MLRKRDKRQKRLCRCMLSNNTRLMLWSWRLNRLVSKLWFPHRCHAPPHVTPVPSPQQSDAASTVHQEGTISDFDLAFGDDRGSNKKPKVDHPPQVRIPLAPPNPRDIESAVNGSNYQLEDLRKLRDLVDEKLRTQASSSQIVPLTG